MKYKYKPYEQDVVLLKGIADIHPYKLHLPDCPPPEQITNYGLHPHQQVFQREVLPRELLKIDRMVKTGQLSRDEGIAAIEADPVLTKYVEGLWRKRTGQDLVFQYINGRPVHIPPNYWMYLNFWQMPKVPNERPMFRMDFHHHCTDLWLFAFWYYLVKPDPFNNGMIMFTQRQVGKSYIGAFLGWEAVSFDYEAHAGSQSKTDKDIAKVYNKCLVRPWSNLLFFWKPKYSNSSYPKAEGMQFTPNADRSKNKVGEIIVDGEEYLMGSFDYRPSSVDAYDGDTLDYYWCDESGKTTEIDVGDRWATVKESLKRRGGKAFFGTTVEEIDKKGGKYFWAIWDDSDRSPISRGQKKITVDANGETDSGLWPWYCPSYCNECFDIHGIAIVDTITERQIEYLKSVAVQLNIKYPTKSGMEAVNYQIEREKNQQKRQVIIRKKPRTIKEARSASTNFCHYNRAILQERIGYFQHGYTTAELPESQYPTSEIQNEVKDLSASEKSLWNYSPGVRWGKFEWIDPTKPYKCGVYFQPTAYEDAKFHVNHLLDPGMRNRWAMGPNNKWKPANAAKFRSGADPFKYDTPDVKNKNKMSDGAQHVYMFYDAVLDGKRERKRWISNNFIYEYKWRSDAMGKEELFEDYAKACIYYGCKLYPERNLADVLDHFKRVGLEHYIHLGIRVGVKDDFIGYKQETVGGDITNKLVIQNMHRHLADFVNNDGSSCIFFRTLIELEEIEDDFNPYDLTVSAAYTLMAAYEANVSNKATETPASVTKEDLMVLTDGFGWN